MSFPTRSAWRAARSDFVREWMTTGAPYLEDPAAPDWIRDGMPVPAWLALSVEERADRLRRAGRREFELAVPMPAPADHTTTPRSRVAPPSTPPHRLAPRPPKYATEAAWRYARRAYAEHRFLPAAAPFITGDRVAEAPAWVFNAASGLTRKDWVALDPEARRERARRSAYQIFDYTFPAPRLLDPSDPDAWTRYAAPGEYEARPTPASTRRQAVAPAQSVATFAPMPAQGPASSSASGRAFVLCPACGDHVAARPGRAAVLSDKECLHD